MSFYHDLRKMVNNPKFHGADLTLLIDLMEIVLALVWMDFGQQLLLARQSENLLADSVMTPMMFSTR
jgi:hypothetical protein